MSDPLITAVRFEDAHGRRLVHATFDDGREERLFGFFADEILFSEGDFLARPRRRRAACTSQGTATTCSPES